MNSSIFPQAEAGSPGYDREEVDAFLIEAKSAYEVGTGDATVTVQDIRNKAFTLRRNGYSTAHVDAALERLEDVFAGRVREAAIAAGAEAEYMAGVRETAQAAVDRLARPAGRRFKRASWATLGYNRTDVDQFGDKIMRYFTEGWPITPSDVRTIVFREQRGGYREDQVDAFLDAIVDAMLAVRS